MKKKIPFPFLLLMIAVASVLLVSCASRLTGVGGGSNTPSGSSPPVVTICGHEYVDGSCTKCGEPCEHIYMDGACTNCGESCEHIFADGICAVCALVCLHDTYEDGMCIVCNHACVHEFGEPSYMHDGFWQHECRYVCHICGYRKSGTYESCCESDGNADQGGICAKCGGMINYGS